MYKIFITFLLFILSNLSLADYVNTNGKAINKPLSDLLEWRSNRVKPIISSINISNNWKNISNTEKHYGIWIGHSTFYINNGNLDILTDPIFSERASPIKFAGPKRLINTPLNVSDLKNVDVVTISHNHYDHLDIESIKKIYKKNTKFNLEDLKSRIRSFLFIGIELPTDDLLKVIITKTLSDKQVSIDPKLLKYIINNVERSYEKMFKFLKDVDDLSLSSGKSININLIKKVLNKLKLNKLLKNIVISGVKNNGESKRY